MQKKTGFELAIKTKYPEQLVIVIAKDAKGKANPVTLGWTMVASYEPPIMAVALFSGHYTTKAIRRSKCFTIAYPSSEMKDAALFFGTHSGWDIDKFAEFDCKTLPAKKIDSLLLDDAVANFECQLLTQKAVGDHIVFFGKIVASHTNTKRKKRLYTLGPNYKLGPTS